MTQIYECVLLMHPGLAEDGVDGYQEQFSKIITDAGGEILHTQKWGKRRLQYPIARQNEAFYILICFQMDSGAGGTVIAELERQVRINDELLREMTVKVKTAKVMDPPSDRIEFGRGGPRSFRGGHSQGRPGSAPTPAPATAVMEEPAEKSDEAETETAAEETPAADQTEAPEKPKAEEPKAEEPAEEPKAAEAEAEEPAEEPKAAEAEAEEPAEEPKPVEAEAEEPAEETAEETKAAEESETPEETTPETT